jgi:hypothetical protein
MKKSWNGFLSKAAVRRHAQEILYRLKDIHPGTEEYSFLLALLKEHLRSAEKIGSGIACFCVEQMRDADAPNFYIRRTDGSIEDFSFYKCIAAIGRTAEQVERAEQAKHLASAYRNAVWEFIQNFRDAHEPVCAICGDLIGERIDVDHMGISFQELTRLFEEWRVVAPPTEFADCGEDYGYHQYAKRFRAEDHAYEASWFAFHAEHATLRVTCTTCNLKRGR